MCDSDLGSPVFRSDGRAVVGVTANFTLGTNLAFPKTVLHTRLDSSSGLQVAAWLEDLGVQMASAPAQNAGSARETEAPGDSKNASETPEKATTPSTTPAEPSPSPDTPSEPDPSQEPSGEEQQPAGEQGGGESQSSGDAPKTEEVAPSAGDAPSGTNANLPDGGDAPKKPSKASCDASGVYGGGSTWSPAMALLGALGLVWSRRRVRRAQV